MATIHGLSGQFAKDEARRKSERIAVVLITVPLLLGTAIGFITGRFPHALILGITLMVLVAVAAYFVVKWFGKKIDREGRERIKYLRGGQCEGLVAWILKGELASEWHIFNGIKIENKRDVDHVLVGPQGVFLLSTKPCRGHFSRAVDGSWNHNGKPTPHVDDAMYQTMALVDRLRGLMGSNVPFVQAVLAVPLAWVDGDRANDKVWVLHQENMTERISPDPPRKRMSRTDVDRMVKVLSMLQASAANVYQRPERDPDRPSDVG